LLNRRNGRQHVVVDDDEIESFLSGLFIHRADCGHRLSDVADLVYGKGRLVLSRWHDTVAAREVGSSDDFKHPWLRSSPRHVEARDLRMWMRTSQDTAVGHPRQLQVVGVPGGPGNLGVTVDLRERLSDYLHDCHPFSILALREQRLRKT